MGLIRWIAGFALAVLIAAFAVANRQTVDVSWNPLRGPLHAPLFLVVLIALAFGFLLGAFMVWLNDLPVKFSSRSQRRKILTLEKELEAANKNERAAAEGSVELLPPPQGGVNGL